MDGSRSDRGSKPRVARIDVASRSCGTAFSNSAEPSLDTFAVGRLITSVKPIPKHGNSVSFSGRRTSTPSAWRARSLSLESDSAVQKRFVARAK
jgi:hypothetical protein